MKIQLCCAPVNTKLKILSVTGENRCRLSELGFSKNNIIFIKNATFNHGTITVSVKDSLIALRHDEAEYITVEISEDIDVHI
jgi:Fe2+ transport system protein FeoA